MLEYQVSHCSAIAEVHMFMLSVDCKLQGSADVSVNYLNCHSQARQLEAYSGFSYWPAHTVAVID